MITMKIEDGTLIIPPNFKIFDIGSYGWESSTTICYLLLPEGYDVKKLLDEFEIALGEPKFDLTREYSCWDTFKKSYQSVDKFYCSENEINPNCDHCGGIGYLKMNDDNHFSHHYPQKWREICKTYLKWEQDSIEKWGLKEEQSEHESEEGEIEVYMKGEQLIRVFQMKEQIFKKWLQQIHSEIYIADDLIKIHHINENGESSIFNDISYRYSLDHIDEEEEINEI